MKRITTDEGSWFDADKATKYEETKRWDGNNHISNATGSQWNHETLYLTASERWVVVGWSQWQGRENWCHVVRDKEAYLWLLRCGYDIPEKLAQYDAEAEL